MIKEKIMNGKTCLGIELGSTRIKASLIDDTYTPIAGGSYDWENSFEDGYWTYSLEDIHKGVQECFKSLSENVYNSYGIKLETIGAIGVSAMMHGYLAFDKEDNLLTPFRTWRNTTTKEAAEKLTEEFNFNIPQRWSISHLYQAILNDEAHVTEVAHITTLAGYIHYLLTGKREVGIGDASGIFPVNGTGYDVQMLEKFDMLINDKGYAWDIKDILPDVKNAGERGAYLTEEGARFLDCSGTLKSGVLVCPPEGDAGTGMVATNSVSPKTGNISAGTSVFAMLVLEEQLKKVYPQIDIVTTPDGYPVAMVHCNNCCGELDTWVKIFGEVAELFGCSVDKSLLYETLYRHGMKGNSKGLVAYNYLSGEHVTDVSNGKPMYLRLPDVKMSLADFMKTQLYSSISTLALGMDILFKNENVSAEKFFGHGGLFKVQGVAQQVVANALNTPVSVMDTAGEGGAWGMALLAAYMLNKESETLGQWLSSAVFGQMNVSDLLPEQNGVEEFKEYIKNYKNGLALQHKAEEVY